MMTLWPSLPLDPEETLLSYADRLSMLHSGRGMNRLVKDFGINTEHFISGRDDAVETFAEACGLPLNEVRRASIQRVSWGGSFRGEAISKGFLTPQAEWYCPACLAEDGCKAEWKARLIWGFRHVVRCDRHSAWLVAAPIGGATNLREAMGTAVPESAFTSNDETPMYVSWLRGRLFGAGEPRHAWLNGQSLEQVLAASEMLGAVLEHGHKVALRKLSSAQVEDATDIGFSIYSEGPEAVEEALDTIRETSPAKAVQAGPLAHYGNLFDWLDRRSNRIDPGPIRDLLRDHIVKHSAIEPGTKVLGVEITERRYHTIQSLSEAVRIDRSRLSRLLKKLGEIPGDATEVASGNMVFEVDKVVPLIEAFTTAIRLHDVAEYLGASQRQVEVLYRAGLIKPLVPRNQRGAVRNVVFGRAHLDDVLKLISDLPVLSERSQGKFHPISYACQRGAGRFEEIFPDVLEGRILAFRNPETRGIASIHVEVGSLVALRKSA